MTMPSAQERLNRARTASLEGRYEEALGDFVWFHEHALEEQPSLAAVRLSYALSYWMELAEVYPPARAMLEELRDKETALLLEGCGERKVFHDIVAMNRYLGSENNTYALFTRLVQSHPELAMRCGSLALPSVISAGDFELAQALMPNPMRDTMALGRWLNKTVSRHKEDQNLLAIRLKAHISGYTEDIKQILSVLVGCGRNDDADRLKTFAINQVEAPEIRESVRDAFGPNPRPWYE